MEKCRDLLEVYLIEEDFDRSSKLCECRLKGSLVKNCLSYFVFKIKSPAMVSGRLNNAKLRRFEDL